MSLLGNERLCLIVAASLYFEIDLIGGHLASIFQINALPKIQVHGKGNIVAVYFAVLDGLLELFAAHGSSELPAIGLEFESDVVVVAVGTRLVSGPGAGGIGSQQKSRAQKRPHENALHHHAIIGPFIPVLACKKVATLACFDIDKASENANRLNPLWRGFGCH